MNSLSYCSHKALALELSEEHTRLLDTKAEIPWDLVRSSFTADFIAMYTPGFSDMFRRS